MISKKDLLQETKISYGQLYRWKREGLIPDSWFIKQSSYTGQETFFPKDKILERIKTIQELKDQYSLEELAKILSPQINGATYVLENQLNDIKELDYDILNIYKEIFKIDKLKYYDLIFIMAFHEMKEAIKISNETIGELIKVNENKIKQVTSINHIMVVIYMNQDYYLNFMKEESNNEFYFDERMKIVFKESLSDLSDRFRNKHKDMFI